MDFFTTGPEQDTDTDREHAEQAMAEAEFEHWKQIVKNQLLTEGWRPPQHSVELAAQREMEKLAAMAIPF